ncbi:hypothetical protein [Sphingobacterium sp. BS-2]|uniref:M61 family metallopeptidase n=1 Tax=Sphingobacterium sp. BS-2 TaxID=3377129 RepID=UPI0038FC856C
MKWIRPIGLGPFDYSRPNRTNGLWLSEGLTLNYENIVLKGAGLIGPAQVLEDWKNTIQGYENNAGRKKNRPLPSRAGTPGRTTLLDSAEKLSPFMKRVRKSECSLTLLSAMPVRTRGRSIMMRALY